jgi:hypothetical protein
MMNATTNPTTPKIGGINSGFITVTTSIVVVLSQRGFLRRLHYGLPRDSRSLAIQCYFNAVKAGGEFTTADSFRLLFWLNIPDEFFGYDSDSALKNIRQN